jgi:DNA polymerase (family 10)
MPVQNAEIAAMFDQTAELLEILGENPFRVRAYRRAARVVEGLPKNVASLLASGSDLSELPGIGKDLAGKIAAIVESGKFTLLEELKRKLPGQLAEIAALPGLGPKRVKLLYDQLKVRTLDDLRRAVKAGRLRQVRGLGAAVERKVSDAIAKPTAGKRFKLPVAEAEASALLDWMRPVGKVIVAGSYRRRRDTVGDLDLLVAAVDGAAVAARFTSYENVSEVVARGTTRSSVVLRSGLQVDLRVVPEESYGAALLYFTGSKAHNIALRAIAVERGWKLNEYGLFAGARRIAGQTEEEVYKKLGLAFVPPELREDAGEIAAARSGKLPTLVTQGDIRGDLHVHSDWSDGTVAIADMAAAAQACGYAYMALTDHSRRVTIAHGLTPARVLRQIAEIDRLNAKLRGFTILKGIEVDILRNGSLDLPDSTLARLDIVVAAVHSAFGLSREEQTERIVRAMHNPHVSVLAHPTGRLIGQREAFDIDTDRIFAAARETGCALEINAEPDRLDLNDVHARAAKAAGARFAISTDAHSVGALQHMRLGVDQARRGWLGAADVINTRSLADLRKLLKRSPRS